MGGGGRWGAVGLFNKSAGWCVPYYCSACPGLGPPDVRWSLLQGPDGRAQRVAMYNDAKGGRGLGEVSVVGVAGVDTARV